MNIPVFSRCEECFAYKRKILELEIYIYELECKFDKIESCSESPIPTTSNDIICQKRFDDNGTVGNNLSITVMLNRAHESLKDLPNGTVLEITNFKRLKNCVYKILTKQGKTYISDKENTLYIDKIIHSENIVNIQDKIYSPRNGDLIYKLSKIGMKKNKNIYSYPTYFQDCLNFKSKTYIPYLGKGFVPYSRYEPGTSGKSRYLEKTNVNNSNILSWLVKHIEVFEYYSKEPFYDVISLVEPPSKRSSFLKCIDLAKSLGYDIIIQNINKVGVSKGRLETIRRKMVEYNVNIYIIVENYLYQIEDYLTGKFAEYRKVLEAKYIDYIKLKEDRKLLKTGKLIETIREEHSKESNNKLLMQWEKDGNWYKIYKTCYETGIYDFIIEHMGKGMTVQKVKKAGKLSAPKTAELLNLNPTKYPVWKGRKAWTSSVVWDTKRNCHHMHMKGIFKDTKPSISIKECEYKNFFIDSSD
eukprot:TRINITY_DN11832_c0_g1_i1.p1 TRINITY_DN11832_c0_g1~~TRINITY_DN11832_c0_g1_i1.p1  ORF type:complete len:480 (+),score=50.39 TRINITY_DN11832_c0_g1_i1:29-1441(+)